mgnify:CR=1 FL=1
MKAKSEAEAKVCSNNCQCFLQTNDTTPIKPPFLHTTLTQWMRETGDVGLVPEPELNEMMRPKGRWQKTAPPKLTIVERGENWAKVALEPVTEGSSISYRIDGGEQTKQWLLYTQPVIVHKGETLMAKACRLGCLDSDEIRWRLGDPFPSVQPSEPIPDWRSELDRSGVLERLLELKMLDGQGEAALPVYLKALNDRSPAIRYWAIVGIHHAVKDETKRRQLMGFLAEALNDLSPTVQVAAAHALCDWGDDRGTTALKKLMRHEDEFVRLYAIKAVRHLGEKAHLFLPEVKEALNESSQYVQRVARTTLKLFGLLAK